MALLVFAAVSMFFCFSVYLTEKYSGIPHGYLIGWALLFAIMIFSQLVYFKKPPGRLLVIIFASLISLRYMAWRTTTTLIYTNTLDAVGLIALYLAECYALIIHFLGMFTSIWPLEREKAAISGDPSDYPTVDVLIPTYSEPVYIAGRTATAATQIKYPREKLRIFILDDGAAAAKRAGGEQGPAWERCLSLRKMAGEIGIAYIARENNDHAKAGNINHAIRKTDGDLILILDCDHVPTKDILENTVGYFQRDKKLGFVQTPHFLGKPSVIEQNISAYSNSPRENDMFYNIIHRGLDLWNSSYFCGSAAVIKREALEKIGGLAVDSITEDVETSIKIHAHGYNSAYVRRPMICGLEPDTLASFITQKTRWAQGMAQIFVLKNPMLQKGITLAQRLNYFNACFYWFFGLPRLLFFISPVLFLGFGMRIYHASSSQIVSYALPHIISIYVLMNFLYGRSRRLLFSEIYETCQMMFLSPALLAVFLRPKSPVFKITPKGERVEKDSLGLIGAMPIFFILLINLAAIPLSLHKWFLYPLYRDVILIGSIWCTYNSFIAVMALGAFFERKENRVDYRFRIKEKIDLFFPRINTLIGVEAQDLSFSGMYAKAVASDSLAICQAVGGNESAASWKSAFTCGEAVVIRATDSEGGINELHGIVKEQKMVKDALYCSIQYDMAKNTYEDIVRFTYGDSRRWTDILKSRNTMLGRRWLLDYYPLIRRGAKAIMICSAHLVTFSALLIKKVLWMAGGVIRLPADRRRFV